jgi:hypothetical protein
MVAKKSESDKYVRVAFTMEPELHSSVIEKVKAEKATLSGLISSLLAVWASGRPIPANGGNKSAPCVDDTSIQEMMGRIKALEETVSKLISSDDYQCAKVNITIDVPDKGLSDDQLQPTNIHAIKVAEVNDIPHGVSIITKELPTVDDLTQETQKNTYTPVTIDLDSEGWYTQ